ncbi:MAG: hypothetical protein OWS74_03735, partial [Firmicutes bacterium]|nr:hypothetical protein [Bacillota bacterium]
MGHPKHQDHLVDAESLTEDEATTVSVTENEPAAEAPYEVIPPKRKKMPGIPLDNTGSVSPFYEWASSRDWEQEARRHPTLLIRRTLRSGQHIRFYGHVVVLGDVNPGAEIV